MTLRAGAFKLGHLQSMKPVFGKENFHIINKPHAAFPFPASTGLGFAAVGCVCIPLYHYLPWPVGVD